MACQKILAEDAGEDIELPITTLQALLGSVAKEHSERIALICKHQAHDFLDEPSLSHEGAGEACLRWTHGQLYSVAHRLATSLKASGVSKGSPIAAFLKNGAQYAIVLYAAAILGCTFVPINATLATKTQEVQHVLHTAEAEVLFVWDDQMAEGIRHAMGEQLSRRLQLKVICNESRSTSSPPAFEYLADMLSPKLQGSKPSLADGHKTTDNDLAMIIFTSGTTSKPKAVGKSNRTLVASIRSHAQTQGLDESRSFCDNLPSFHVYGLMWMLAFWSRGGSVCFPSEVFEPEATLQAIHDEQLTNLAGVPTMMQAVIAANSGGKANLGSLLSVAVAGSMVFPETVKSMSRGLGVDRITTSFGMSEASPCCSIAYRELPYEFQGDMVTAGKCSPGVRMRICAPDSREILERDVPGELVIGGETVLRGYLGLESSSETFSRSFFEDDGTSWFRTGDQAIMAENGEIFIQGRYKDIFIRAGENIAPASIEAVIDSLPEVSTSQVVGVQDEIAGEVPLAVVKSAIGADISKDTVHDVVVEKLGTLYVPTETVTLEDLGIDDFPKTDSGKVQKAKLKEVVDDYLQARDSPSRNGSMSDQSRDGGASSVDDLHQIWSSLLSLSKERLTTSTSVVELADSITIMRSVHKIKRELGYTMTTREIWDHPTIESQAKLLQDRRQDSSSSTVHPQVTLREGPPIARDMAHTGGSLAIAHDTQSAFEECMSATSLTWQDVEDVVPISDFLQVMLRRLRAQSWNHRHAWRTTAGPERLRSALELALKHNAMLRTISAQPKDTSPLHYIVRPSAKLFQLMITTREQAVAAADDLRTLCLNDPHLDFAAAPGPLFRAIIVPIKECGSGLVYQAQHSCFDGLSMPNLNEDLRAILSQGEEVHIAPRTPYKLFADALYLHGDSVQAQTSVAFHVKRLKGLANFEKSLWPVQRAPQWFKGNFDDVDSDLIKNRPLLDGKDSIGVDGVMKRTKLPHLHQLTQQHGFAVPAVLKTALALLNISYTKQNEAVFTNYEAGRDWSFLEEWIAERLPNTMDINGPTLEAVLNIIPVKKKGSETCVEMISRVHEEQKLLTQHAHAPLFAIQRGLGDVDGTNLIDVMRRQIFNWLPGLKSAAGLADPQNVLQRIHVQSRSDVGILWNCGMLDQETFQMTASYDDAQLRKAEVEGAVGRLFEIAEWITKPENWKSDVGECPVLGMVA